MKSASKVVLSILILFTAFLVLSPESNGSPLLGQSEIEEAFLEDESAKPNSSDENACFSECARCTGPCGSNESCNEACYTIAASCCKIVGKTGRPHSCVCDA
jgi:hypothetical protein